MLLRVHVPGVIEAPPSRGMVLTAVRCERNADYRALVDGNGYLCTARQSLGVVAFQGRDDPDEFGHLDVLALMDDWIQLRRYIAFNPIGPPITVRHHGPNGYEGLPLVLVCHGLMSRKDRTT